MVLRLGCLLRIVVRLGERRDRPVFFLRDVKRLLAGKRRKRGILGGKTGTSVNDFAVLVM